MPRLENAEGVDEQIVEAIVATKKKELDAMEAFGIFDVRRIANEMGKRSERRQVEMQVEFRHDDPEMDGLYTSGSTSATGRLVDMHAVQHGHSILCLDAESA